jgi:hypothetical protein
LPIIVISSQLDRAADHDPPSSAWRARPTEAREPRPRRKPSRLPIVLPRRPLTATQLHPVTYSFIQTMKGQGAPSDTHIQPSLSQGSPRSRPAAERRSRLPSCLALLSDPVDRAATLAPARPPSRVIRGRDEDKGCVSRSLGAARPGMQPPSSRRVCSPGPSRWVASFSSLRAGQLIDPLPFVLPRRKAMPFLRPSSD